MQIRLLTTFQTIVRLGSFHRAAEALQYSQPTISSQIKKLEDELGVKLFERSKTIKLTRDGQFIYERAETLLKEHADFNSTLADISKGEAGMIALGAAEPGASRILPEVISSFMIKKPKIGIKIIVGTNQELMQKVLNDEVDYALCHQPEPHLIELCHQSEPNVELEFHPMLFERFILLIPENHRLADQEDISLSDLREEKLLLTPTSCPFRIKLESMVSRKLGSSLKDSIEVGSVTAIKYYVQAGIGVALIPEIEADPPLSGTVIKKVIDIERGPEIGVLAKRNAIIKGTYNEALFEEFRETLSRSSSFHDSLV